jgi:hypothetical protein
MYINAELTEKKKLASENFFELLESIRVNY